ncbi:2410_t:CDS:2 [Cetraspora pellucida]|uniref:2410_t:CDS:1 n=1 Tax=Cetraspora pellucida TaxID=1433469 RepID=A0A9N9BQ01_9GLOM|nr:2410_t:CDS:2 [Cetraspora pellucida]
MNDKSKLTELISCLLTDNSFTIYEYIYTENNKVKSGLTKEEILKIVKSENKEKGKKEEFIEQEKFEDADEEFK